MSRKYADRSITQLLVLLRQCARSDKRLSSGYWEHASRGAREVVRAAVKEITAELSLRGYKGSLPGANDYIDETKDKKESPVSHKDKWKTIDDADVRHIWANPDGTNETAIDPTFYAENGTPLCDDDDEEHGGADMIYVRTEVKTNDSIIMKAARFAGAAHHGQTRKQTNAPYITHPGRVAARVSRVSLADDTWVAAAWCHDVLEDCPVTFEELASRIGKDAALIVQELTNPSKDHKKLPRADRKQMDREHLSKCSLAAKCIKLADRADNLNEMSLYSDDFKKLYLDESEELRKALHASIPLGVDCFNTLCYELDDTIKALRLTIKETP